MWSHDDPGIAGPPPAMLGVLGYLGGGGSFPTHSSFPAQGRHAAVASWKEKEMLQKKKVILMNIALHF